MIAIRAEVRAIEAGALPRDDNPLKHAPHTALAVCASDWPHGYTREHAAYPVETLRESKYWCPVARVDNVYGDRNLFCSCVPVDESADADAGDRGRSDVLVLGGGVVGVTSARASAGDGHEVTVVDRRRARRSTSPQRGQISASYAEPWGNPGAPLKILKCSARRRTAFSTAA
jgi:hypothetical protein